MPTLKKHYKTLRLILGDQLNAQHSWYKQKDASTLYVIAELKQETSYVKHHGQKLCAFFAAMAQFANALQQANHQVLYLTLDQTHTFTSLPALIKHLCKEYSIEHFEYQRPDEHRLLTQLTELDLPKKIKQAMVDSEHFLLPIDEISDHFSEGKHHKMEFFYRKMRRRFNILMDNHQPLGGQWNYDAENRSKLKKEDLEHIPQPLLFANDVGEITERIDKHTIEYFGKTDKQLLWPTNRQQATKLLRFFCEYCLPQFGKFQDAMTCNSAHQWSLYHSRLSFALNSKILHPLTVINEAINAFEQAAGDITLPQIEGFIRQILGWREYIRGVYWANMPKYQTLNHFNAKQNLPKYFWTGKTKMQCMKQAIEQSLDYAYAHHIQRLMITGNFCLLTGIDPKQVDAWYLGIYIDAIEWVEMPNTRGMSQFADGGLIATKPYAAGGNYINKMSDYCKNCHYKIKEKTGETACPFNSLYWGFMIKHKEEFEKNPRIGMIYHNWGKQEQDTQQAVLKRAAWCIENLDYL